MKTIAYKGLSFSLPDADTAFSPKIFKWVEEVSTVVKLTGALPGRVFVDVGACFGVSTIAALATGRFDSAIAFEPWNDNLELLRKNLRDNGVSDRVRVVPAALGRENRDDMAFHPPHASNIGGGRILPGSSARVACRTLDFALEELACPLDDVGLVWIDSQGCEGHIMAGAPKLITKTSPWYVEVAPWLMEEIAGQDLFMRLALRHFKRFVDIKQITAPRGIIKLKKLYASYRVAVKRGQTLPRCHTNVLLLRN